MFAGDQYSRSAFESVYRGTGKTPNLAPEYAIQILVKFIMDMGRDLRLPEHESVNFRSEGGSENCFWCDTGNLYFSTNNPTRGDLDRDPVVGVLGLTNDMRVADQLQVITQSANGDFKAWVVKPNDFNYVKLLLLPLLNYVGVPHDIEEDVPDRPVSDLDVPEFLDLPGGREARILEIAQREVSNLIRLCELQETAGFTKLYTSNISVWGVQLYKLFTGVLNEDDLERLGMIVPIVKKINYYVNDVPHAGGQLFSGGYIGPEGWNNIQRWGPGACMRVARIWSTTRSSVVAEDFKLDVVFVIHVPRGFVGAREISDISFYEEEAETVFCPWSQFMILSYDLPNERVHLAALDKYYNVPGDVAPMVYPREHYESLLRDEQGISLLPTE